MGRRVRGRLALAVLQLLIGVYGVPRAWADDAALPGDLPPSTVERDVHLFIVQKDGSVEEHDDTVLRANTTSGVDEIAQRYVWFNKDIEQVQLLAAETVDRDGVAHPVGADGIRDVQEPRSAGAPTFQDGVLRTVIFPGVEPGSRVHLAFRKVRTVPLQAGTFAYFVEPTRGPVEMQKLIFDLPADVPLYTDARGYVAEPPVTENGRTRYTFDYQHGPYAPLESGAVGYATWGDRLMVTTTPDYATFAGRYRDAAVDSTTGDPAIVRLAQQLTAQTNDPREKARILYDWVRFNIRYVALFLGETAAVPHKAVDVLRNRYGDCKDHVALYGALLAAVGIDSEPVLLNLGSVYTLPQVPGYGASAINHVITWIPSLSLFADTTAGGTGFGYLPASVMDRPVLLVDEGVLARTPGVQQRARVARLQIDVDNSGTGRFSYRVQDIGAPAELERNVFRRATRQRWQQIAAERLRQTGLSGVARMQPGELTTTTGPFATTMQGTLEHVSWPDGTTALPALTSLSGGIASQVQTWLTEPRRTQPWACIDGDFDETSQITLPDNVRVTDLPQDAQVHDPFFEFSSHYVFDPDTRIVQITRRLTTRFGHQMCSAEEFQAARASLVRIERDALSQIVVRAGLKKPLARSETQ
ncbi:transglutaminase superfamily protein [Paraburkholderia rhizosphaerae]|uniref:Transglutaminase superfamily protein n=1 Tax=Paraburkholderia rhizosphaerae TaxID=480658 RepID=A0A4R8L583_9BURK|nr:transglutaminase superfamily protein [Paraburkholderia rhizosphaerae]